ncbi:MAG: glutamate-1-semialdehyde aminotransferase [Acetobacteraceae bacterium SCN 69-10]|nr:aminotransferase class III-fold pyridoxal phosphate-dependent enzyme [Rhodospirillales bacterium]ODU62572.1 MAG: glutamate-1-semialdehyde aminotransferase [Acetobacteraceae bacterium SCN 69-10]OJY73061.1 MAG: aspartate aminotransferase family protein [Rhodospirillales bacterium 70-18]
MTEPTAGPRLSFDRSRAAIARSSQWIPGGVNSNFRMNVSPTPLVVESGDGAWLTDIDGNRLIDYYLGMGPMILGHRPQAVCDAVSAQLAKGILFAAQTEAEAEAARSFCEMVPCAERVRFGCSGSEVIQAALRISRAATGRETILKFEGHYHGWFDNILWSVAPPASVLETRNEPTPYPGSQGQLASAGEAVAVLPWNDLAALEARLAKRDIAAVIMEPAMCNAGAIHPAAGYLEGVRAACSKFGTILIFDEVITGFRLAPGGAQQHFGVTPDLATFGKAIANGFPVAAVAGRAELMDLCKAGVLHGGTYNAQPLAMAATAATLQQLTPALYAGIAEHGTRLIEGLTRIFHDAGVPASIVGFPQVFHVGLGLSAPARDYRDLLTMNRPGYIALTTEMLHRGVRVLERGAWFLSSAHDAAVIDETLAVTEDSLRTIRRAGKI